MNELFASEPSICQTEEELQLLMGYFGPFSGRYLAAYPDQWFPISDAALSHLGDVARARINVLLRRAREELRVLPQPTLKWDDKRTWLENAHPYARVVPPVLNGIITNRRAPESREESLLLNDLNLPPTAEERMHTTPVEYVRVCTTLLLRAPELHFIDPYLDLNNSHVRDVISALLKVASRGRCKKVVLWAKYKEIFKNRTANVIQNDLRVQSLNIMQATGLHPGTELLYNLIEDSDTNFKMHARYLLTFKGGVRFDQGFKSLGDGHRMDVGPIGKSAFDEIYSIYFLNRHDMNIKVSLTIPA